MRIRKAFLLLILQVSSLLLAALSFSYIRSPSFMKTDGFSQISPLKPNGMLKWSLEDTAGGMPPVIADNGLIYVIGKQSPEPVGLYAIGEATKKQLKTEAGTEKWRFKMSYGCVSPPAIGTDGTIYASTCEGYLYALYRDGTERWRFNTGSPGFPVIGADGTVYIGSLDGVYAISPNGTEQWHFPTKGSYPSGGVLSPPAIGIDGTIYVGSLDNYLYALDPDGSLKWEFQTDDDVISSTIGSDGTIYVVSKDGYLYALNSAGSLLWRFETGIVEYPPAIGKDGIVYLCLGSHLYSILPNGMEKWRFKTQGPIISAPAIGADGMIYVGSTDGILYAISPDGRESWRFDTGAMKVVGLTIGPDGIIYVGSDYWLHALWSSSVGLANSPWPMFQHDPQHTGRSVAISPRPSVTPGKVDLAIAQEDITFSRVTEEKAAITIKAAVHNIGDADASNVEVLFTRQLGCCPPLSCPPVLEEIARVTIRHIAAGGIGIAQAELTLSQAEPSSTWTSISVVVDPDNQISEENKANNGAIGFLRECASAEGYCPKVTSAAIELDRTGNPPLYLVGETVTITMKFYSNGNLYDPDYVPSPRKGDCVCILDLWNSDTGDHIHKTFSDFKRVSKGVYEIQVMAGLPGVWQVDLIQAIEGTLSANLLASAQYNVEGEECRTESFKGVVKSEPQWTFKGKGPATPPFDTWIFYVEVSGITKQTRELKIGEQYLVFYKSSQTSPPLIRPGDVVEISAHWIMYTCGDPPNPACDAVALVVDPSCGETVVPTKTKACGTVSLNPRVIEFSGYEWIVKDSEEGKKGPGPNYWSDSDQSVCVDEQGRLHLKITEQDGKWYSAEVLMKEPLGYGEYIFKVIGRVDRLDTNVVMALFNYLDDKHEIDIEFSRWGERWSWFWPWAQNAQFVVQPYEHAGNRERFHMRLNGNYSTHRFIWNSDSIFFQSTHGHHDVPPDQSYVIHEWTYRGNDIPAPMGLNPHISLWLYAGNPPSDGNEVEIIIDRFEFHPRKPWLGNPSFEGCDFGLRRIRDQIYDAAADPVSKCKWGVRAYTWDQDHLQYDQDPKCDSKKGVCSIDESRFRFFRVDGNDYNAEIYGSHDHPRSERYSVSTIIQGWAWSGDPPASWAIPEPLPIEGNQLYIDIWLKKGSSNKKGSSKKHRNNGDYWMMYAIDVWLIDESSCMGADKNRNLCEKIVLDLMFYTAPKDRVDASYSPRQYTHGGIFHYQPKLVQLKEGQWAHNLDPNGNPKAPPIDLSQYIDAALKEAKEKLGREYQKSSWKLYQAEFLLEFQHAEGAVEIGAFDLYYYEGGKRTPSAREEMRVTAFSPVDLVLKDPEGLIINKQSSGISNATYAEADINGDGDPDDQIVIPSRKFGDYQISVIPEPRAAPDDTYTLEVSAGAETIVLANKVQIKDIPNRPYAIKSATKGISPVTTPGIGPGLLVAIIAGIIAVATVTFFILRSRVFGR